MANLSFLFVVKLSTGEQTNLTIADWIVTVVAAIKTIKFTWTIWIFDGKTRRKFELTSYHSNILQFLSNTDLCMRSHQRHSLWCTRMNFFRIDRYRQDLSPGPLKYSLDFGEKKDKKTYKHSVNGSKSSGRQQTKTSDWTKSENLIFAIFGIWSGLMRTPYLIFPCSS